MWSQWNVLIKQHVLSDSDWTGSWGWCWGVGVGEQSFSHGKHNFHSVVDFHRFADSHYLFGILVPLGSCCSICISLYSFILALYCLSSSIKGFWLPRRYHDMITHIKSLIFLNIWRGSNSPFRMVSCQIGTYLNSKIGT